jgi:primosomal protein N'
MQQPFAVANDELTSRVQYQLPPVYRWCRITLKESEKRKAEIAVNQLREQLKRLDHVSLHALEWNRDAHAQFDVGIPAASFPDLRDLFTGLGDQYIIDTNVFS